MMGTWLVAIAAIVAAVEAQAGSTLVDDLKGLAELRAQGSLTEEEFASAKSRLLSSDGGTHETEIADLMSRVVLDHQAELKKDLLQQVAGMIDDRLLHHHPTASNRNPDGRARELQAQGSGVTPVASRIASANVWLQHADSKVVFGPQADVCLKRDGEETLATEGNFAVGANAAVDGNLELGGLLNGRHTWRSEDIVVNGCTDQLYPVVWRWPTYNLGHITIGRYYPWNGYGVRPLNPSSTHQASLYLELEGEDTCWGGQPQIMNLINYGEHYAGTASHVQRCGFCTTEPIVPSQPQTYGVGSTSSVFNTGVYLRGGGLKYRIANDMGLGVVPIVGTVDQHPTKCAQDMSGCSYAEGAGGSALHWGSNIYVMDGSVDSNKCLPKSTSTMDNGSGADFAGDQYHGWFDVQGCGFCNDYCRWVGHCGGGGVHPAGGPAADPRDKVELGCTIGGEAKTSYWSCRLAGKDVARDGLADATYTSSNPPWKTDDGGSTWRFPKCTGEGARSPKAKIVLGIYGSQNTQWVASPIDFADRVVTAKQDGTRHYSPETGLHAYGFAGFLRLADVAGDVAVTADYWTARIADFCQSKSSWVGARACVDDDIEVTPRDTILVTMGAVKDYYKPTSAMQLTAFLASRTSHSWSATEHGEYVVPSYHSFFYGGSAAGWPSDATDARDHLSFWGSGGIADKKGGCCAQSKDASCCTASGAVVDAACVSADSTSGGPTYELYARRACDGRNELGRYSVGSRSECGARCTAAATCVSFEWWVAGGSAGSGVNCQLSSSCLPGNSYSESRWDLEVKHPRGTYRWYEGGGGCGAGMACSGTSGAQVGTANNAPCGTCHACGADSSKFSFSDRGDTDQEHEPTNTYTVDGLTCALSGWTHTRNYHKGFLRNTAGTATALVTGLVPLTQYTFKVWQFASNYAGTNPLSVNGISQGSTTTTTSDLPTSEGLATASAEGSITFTFTRSSQHVALSAIELVTTLGWGQSFTLDLKKVICN